MRRPFISGKKPSLRVIVLALVFIVGVGVIGTLALTFSTSQNTNVSQAGTQSSGQPAAKPVKSSSQSPKPAANIKPITIVASGDMLPHSAITRAAKTAGGYDYLQFLKPLQKDYQSADVRFCNQETVSAGETFGISGYPTFNVSQQFARDLSGFGCNVINLANNHMNDKGQGGINATLDIWDELKPLAHAGANRNPAGQQAVKYFSVRDVKFAFVSYTEVSNTKNFEPFALNMLREDLVRAQLTEANSKADIVLVGVHWGTEYSAGIDTAQTRWSTLFADLGADAVIGTGPHVLEPVKRIPKAGGGETIVWYSLGNLLSAQLEVNSLIGGIARMEVDPISKAISQISFKPTYMHYEWTADQKAREDLLARRNFSVVPLSGATDLLAKSQNNTTVQAQTGRVKDLLNTYTPVPITE